MSTEEKIAVQTKQEVITPAPQKATAERILPREVSEAVTVIQRHNQAVTYLRHKDCEMLRTLRDHLAENIRLHAILDEINSEISRLKKLLKTPKPPLKVFLIILGFIVAIGGMLIFSDESAVGYYASLIIGIVLVILSIVFKVRDNKKWAKFIADTKTQLEDAENRAIEAQEDIDNYWKNHAMPFISSIIPDQFPKDHVLEYNTVCGMLNIMENLRADTIKDAINLYEERCFRANMRESFRNMEASLYSAARSAERSALAAERSADASEASAASMAAIAVSSASMAASAAKSAQANERAAEASIQASNAVRDRANRD